MIKFSACPNFLNGKIYKKWDSVRKLYGDGGVILACKTRNSGGVEQLLLSDNGKKRELLFPDGKFMEIVDSRGVKRFYEYKKTESDTIIGQMFASKDLNGKLPLILAAKWILRNIVLEKLFLKVNSNHPQAKVFIPNQSPDGTPVFNGTVPVYQVAEVLAKNFDSLNSYLPKTILLKTSKGDIKPIVDKAGEENLKVIQHFGIDSSILGANLRTIV